MLALLKLETRTYVYFELPRTWAAVRFCTVCHNAIPHLLLGKIGSSAQTHNGYPVSYDPAIPAWESEYIYRSTVYFT